MNNSVTLFYDNFSSEYHLLFDNWQHSVINQGEILDKIIKNYVNLTNPKLLDCSCGIGTQAIGLSLKGYDVVATDISSKSIKRAIKEAKEFKTIIRFSIADFRFLDKQIDGTYDVVISCDNSIPHLLTESDLLLALNSMKEKLNPDGLLLLSIRDYDKILTDKPSLELPRFINDSLGKRVTFQLWDWKTDGMAYTLNYFLIKEKNSKWKNQNQQTEYRALKKEELTRLLEETRFSDITWHMPGESGYHQPIVTARNF